MNVSTKPLQHPSVRVHVFLGTGSTIFIIFPKVFVYNRGVTPENLLVLRKAWGAVGRFGVRLAWIPIPANWTIARKLTGLAVLTCSTGCLGWQDEEPWCCVSTMFISYAGSSQFSFPNSHAHTLEELGVWMDPVVGTATSAWGHMGTSKSTERSCLTFLFSPHSSGSGPAP